MPKYIIRFGYHVSEPDFNCDESFAGMIEYDEFSECYEVDDIKISELVELAGDFPYEFVEIELKEGTSHDEEIHNV